MTTVEEPKSAFDDEYAHWKHWHGSGAFTYKRKDAKYFMGQFQSLNLNGARVLEIGFGNGTFLAWAKHQGAKVSGTELNSHSVRLGADLGFDVHLGKVDNIPAIDADRFDLIVLIDVMEHLSNPDLERTLRWVVAHLSERGLCLARVPNEASPFGLVVQNSDATHCQNLSCEIFRQLAPVYGYEVIECRNQYRSWASGVPALRQFIQRGLRRLTESYFRFILEMRSGPLDMNIVVRFRRVPRAAG